MAKLRLASYRKMKNKFFTDKNNTIFIRKKYTYIFEKCNNIIKLFL